MTRPSLIILAGGKGTRLGDLTRDIPKPMVDIFGKPFLYWLIKHYIEQGFINITISTGYKAEVIEYYKWPWRLAFEEDVWEGHHLSYYDADVKTGNWVVNGDTFIPEYLPQIEVYENIIAVCNDTDAGAQHVAYNKIRLWPTHVFYDIGTPEGLERFKEYFKSHPLYLSELTKGIP